MTVEDEETLLWVRATEYLHTTEEIPQSFAIVTAVLLCGIFWSFDNVSSF